MEAQQISVVRQPEYRVGFPSWKIELNESAVQVYDMVVDALSFDENRCSFSVRQPGVGVIMSNNVFIEMRFDVQIPGLASFDQLKGPVFGPAEIANIPAKGAAAANETYGMAYRPKVAFSQGDGFQKSQTNYSLTINGSQISNARQNLYSFALNKCWFSDETCALRFANCGGRYNDYGSIQAVSGEAFQRDAGDNIRMDRGSNHAGANGGVAPGGDLTVCGYTADKGVSSRIDNFLSCVEELPASTAATRLDRFTVVVKAPLYGCGVFSPCTPTDVMSASNPMQASMLALCHISSLQVDILFTSLKENIFRNLSSRYLGAADTIAAGGSRGGIQVSLSTAKPPQLLCRWIRLPSWSAIPSSINCQTYRIATHTPTSTSPGAGVVAIAADQTRSGIGELTNALPCVGTGRKASGRCAPFDATRFIECEWKNLVSSQPPQYLAFILSKSANQLVLGDGSQVDGTADDCAGKQINAWTYARGAALADGDVPHVRGDKAGLLNYFTSRNSDALACITNFEMRIQTAVGSYLYAAADWPYIRNRQQLFRDHLRSTVDGYCNGSFAEYSKHHGMLLLSSDLWLRGISTPNASFPVTISAKCRFESRREYVDGHSCAAAKGRAPAVQQDCIQGQAVCCMIFTGGSLQISPSSSLNTSANVSHAQSLDVLSRG